MAVMRVTWRWRLDACEVYASALKNRKYKSPDLTKKHIPLLTARLGSRIHKAFGLSGCFL